LCGSRKYPYPHHRGTFEILRGRRVLKAKILKESMSLNWNFQGGGGVQTFLTFVISELTPAYHSIIKIKLVKKENESSVFLRRHSVFTRNFY